MSRKRNPIHLGQRSRWWIHACAVDWKIRKQGYMSRLERAPQVGLGTQAGDVRAGLRLSNSVHGEGSCSCKTGRRAFRLFLGSQIWRVLPPMCLFCAVGYLDPDGVILRTMALGFIVSVIGLPIAFWFITKRAFERGVGIFAATRIELGTEGCRITMRGVFHSIRWSQFIYYKERPGILIVLSNISTLHVVYRDLFESDADFERASDLIRGNVTRK